MPIKVGVVLPKVDDFGEWLNDAAAYDAAGADLLWIEEDGEDPLALAAALAAVTYKALLIVRADVDDKAIHTVQRISRGRLRINSPHETEHWVWTPAPQNREAWRQAIKQIEEHQADGVLVPAGPGVLDLLRNPGDPGERRDLELTVG
jgi:alkanesulfonate monooxygenase SsuD/methylene tetrahydromethanopterin reductase-like flavin-dependent oxidoreductase (luciferase family)